MMVMRWSPGLGALAILTGCATRGPEPGVDLLQGCWIEQDQNGGVTTLRLQPAGGEELAGTLSYRTRSGDSNTIRYAFARDGSRMSIGEGTALQNFPRTGRKRAPDPPGEKHMDFLKERTRNSEDTYVISVSGDGLSIGSLLVNRFEAAPYNITSFRRETCD
jgi:hypothetical protein